MGRNVHIGKKNFSPKQDLGFMKVRSLLGGKTDFHINIF